MMAKESCVGFYKLIILIVSSFVLMGCVKKAPKCSDADTVSLVKSIIYDNSYALHNYGDKDKIIKLMDLVNVRPSDYKESVRKYECEAEFGAVGGRARSDISYEVQFDDNDDIVASVHGLEGGFSVIAEIIDRAKSAEFSVYGRISMVSSRFGPISILPGDNPKLKRGNETYDLPKDFSFASYMGVVKLFPGERSDIVLLKSGSGGSACPETHYLVEILESADQVWFSKGIGCSDKLKITTTNAGVKVDSLDGDSGYMEYSK